MFNQIIKKKVLTYEELNSSYDRPHFTLIRPHFTLISPEKNLADFRGFNYRILITLKVLIVSRYRYRPVTIPLPFWGLRYRPLLTVTDRYRSLPNLTVTCVTSVTDRNIRPF